MIPETHGLKYLVVKPDTLLMQLHGNWKVDGDRGPALDALKTLHREKSLRKIEFDTRKMGSWNSGLLTFLLNIHAFCAGHNIEMVRTGLPQGVERILSLALAVPENKEARSAPQKESLTAES